MSHQRRYDDNNNNDDDNRSTTLSSMVEQHLSDLPPLPYSSRTASRTVSRPVSRPQSGARNRPIVDANHELSLLSMNISDDQLVDALYVDNDDHRRDVDNVLDNEQKEAQSSRRSVSKKADRSTKDRRKKKFGVEDESDDGNDNDRRHQRDPSWRAPVTASTFNPPFPPPPPMPFPSSISADVVAAISSRRVAHVVQLDAADYASLSSISDDALRVGSYPLPPPPMSEREYLMAIAASEAHSNRPSILAMSARPSTATKLASSSMHTSARNGNLSSYDEYPHASSSIMNQHHNDDEGDDNDNNNGIVAHDMSRRHSHHPSHSPKRSLHDDDTHDGRGSRRRSANHDQHQFDDRRDSPPRSNAHPTHHRRRSSGTFGSPSLPRPSTSTTSTSSSFDPDAELLFLSKVESAALALQSSARSMDALPLYEQGLATRELVYGSTSSEVVVAATRLALLYNSLAMASLYASGYPLALRLLRRAELLCARANLELNMVAPRVQTLNNLGCVYRRLSRPKTALNLLREGLGLLAANEARIDAQKSNGVDNDDVASSTVPSSVPPLVRRDLDGRPVTHLNICAILSQLHRHTEAREHAKAAVMYCQQQMLHEGERAQEEKAQRRRAEAELVEQQRLERAPTRARTKRDSDASTTTADSGRHPLPFDSDEVDSPDEDEDEHDVDDDDSDSNDSDITSSSSTLSLSSSPPAASLVSPSSSSASASASLLHDRLSESIAILGISYHNLGVELEFLGEFQEGLGWYAKAYKLAREHIGEKEEITKTFKESYHAALKHTTAVDTVRHQRTTANLHTHGATTANLIRPSTVSLDAPYDNANATGPKQRRKLSAKKKSVRDMTSTERIYSTPTPIIITNSSSPPAPARSIARPASAAIPSTLPNRRRSVMAPSYPLLPSSSSHHTSSSSHLPHPVPLFSSASASGSSTSLASAYHPLLPSSRPAPSASRSSLGHLAATALSISRIRPKSASISRPPRPGR